MDRYSENNILAQIGSRAYRYLVGIRPDIKFSILGPTITFSIRPGRISGVRLDRYSERYPLSDWKVCQISGNRPDIEFSIRPPPDSLAGYPVPGWISIRTDIPIRLESRAYRYPVSGRILNSASVLRRTCLLVSGLAVYPVSGWIGIRIDILIQLESRAYIQYPAG